jgi:tRNA threonylcarbamoyladenosine biosynthesis protein TsaB
MTPFRCVAIETATAASSVAACNGDRTEILRLSDARSSSRELYHAVTEVMERVELDMAALESVAFGCGPGSFTGVRVAAAAAQAIAFAQQVPVCRVSSLAALAVAAGQQSARLPVAACLDARMGEAYLGIYARDSSGQLVPLVDDSLVKPADFRFASTMGQVALVGNGWEVFPELVKNNASHIAATEFTAWPEALAVMQLARVKFAAGDVVESFEALPNYLRNQVTF